MTSKNEPSSCVMKYVSSFDECVDVVEEMLSMFLKHKTYELEFKVVFPLNRRGEHLSTGPGSGQVSPKNRKRNRNQTDASDGVRISSKSSVDLATYRHIVDSLDKVDDWTSVEDNYMLKTYYAGDIIRSKHSDSTHRMMSKLRVKSALFVFKNRNYALKLSLQDEVPLSVPQHPIHMDVKLYRAIQRRSMVLDDMYSYDLSEVASGPTPKTVETTAREYEVEIEILRTDDLYKYHPRDISLDFFTKAVHLLGMYVVDAVSDEVRKEMPDPTYVYVQS